MGKERGRGRKRGGRELKEKRQMGKAKRRRLGEEKRMSMRIREKKDDGRRWVGDKGAKEVGQFKEEEEGGRRGPV